MKKQNMDQDYTQEEERGDLYYQVADILKKIKEKKGTLKTLIYSSGFKNLRKIFALVTECVKFEALLEKIASECPSTFLQEPAVNGSLEVSVVLLYEYLLGRKFGRDVRYRKLFQRHKAEIKIAVEKVLTKLGARTIQEACQANGQAGLPKIPRYMRVNLIKSSVDAAIESLTSEGWQFVGKFSQQEFSTQALTLTQWQFGLDPVLPDLLVFPPDTDLHAHTMTCSGILVQQDRASCIPAHVLAPTPGSLVVDCCAAPGNKTSHLASLMCGKGRVVALDRDIKRLNTMQRLLANSGATCLELIHQDFLTVRPDSADAGGVRFILVDPSCSGSGMLNSQTNSLRSEVDASRIQTLKRFQISILKHSLRFPDTERVVYSTCSTHQEENEEVVEEVMSQVNDHFRFAKVLPEWQGSRGLEQFPHADLFLRLSPGQDLTQGFFVACFERFEPGVAGEKVTKDKAETGLKLCGQTVRKRKKENEEREVEGKAGTMLSLSDTCTSERVSVEHGEDIKELKRRKKKRKKKDEKLITDKMDETSQPQVDTSTSQRISVDLGECTHSNIDKLTGRQKMKKKRKHEEERQNECTSSNECDIVTEADVQSSNRYKNLTLISGKTTGEAERYSGMVKETTESTEEVNGSVRHVQVDDVTTEGENLRKKQKRRKAKVDVAVDENDDVKFVQVEESTAESENLKRKQKKKKKKKLTFLRKEVV